MRRWIAAGPALVLLFASPARAEDAFREVRFPSKERLVAAGIADLDGDGRSDLYAVSFSGAPPADRRELRIYFQRESTEGLAATAGFPSAPDFAQPVLEGAAAFDVADLPDGPGQELLVLRRDRVSVLAFAGRRLARRDLMIPGDPTVAVSGDDRGLDRLRMQREELGRERLLVPGLGELILLSTGGELLERIAVGHRANYFVPPRPGPLLNESEIESYHDAARIELGDVDGDGRTDVVAATRYEVRVFRQRPDGSFPATADAALPLGRLSERDVMLGSGGVRVATGDVNGDGRVDLLVASTSGGLVDSRSETTLHLNRAGRWDLAAPDRRTVVERGWSSIELVDVDGDGREELMEARFPFSVLELVETVITREIDLEVTVFRAGPDGALGVDPWIEDSMHIGLDFDTLRPVGFVPSLRADLNGDGILDRLDSADGGAIEVYPGGGERPLQKLAVRQKLDSRGRIRFGDADGDGLTDAVLFAPRRPGTPLRLLLNRGTLPGTRKRPNLRAVEHE